MIKYLKENTTGIIHKFQESETPVYPDQFTPATQNEIAELLLSEAKKAKIEELQKVYDEAITKPLLLTNAAKLDTVGKPSGTIDAYFNVKEADVLKSENTILFSGLFLQIFSFLKILVGDENKFNAMIAEASKTGRLLPYLTQDKNNNQVKIGLSGLQNMNIFNHIFTRVATDSSIREKLTDAVSNAKSVEEVEAIDINILTKKI